MAENDSRPPDQVPPHAREALPGKLLPNRKERREAARAMARQLNRGRRRRVVAWQPGTEES